MKKITNVLFTLCLIFSYSVYSQCFTDINSGSYSFIGKKSDGTFWGSGSNNNGQLNIPDRMDKYSFVPLPNTADLQSITCGWYNTFGIKENGTLWGGLAPAYTVV